jgi:hypothetical protein
MYLLSYFVPGEYLEATKGALFTAGAGKIGNYDCCSWQCLGTGQFRPLAGSQAFIGSLNTVETVAEYRVEMVCAHENLAAVIAALKATHPYETPAFFVTKSAL